MACRFARRQREWRYVLYCTSIKNTETEKERLDNIDKTNYMITSRNYVNGTNKITINNITFETVFRFKYLSIIKTSDNRIQNEVNVKIKKKGNARSYSVLKFLLTKFK